VTIIAAFSPYSLFNLLCSSLNHMGMG